MDSESRLQSEPRSELKAMVGQKRGIFYVEETAGTSEKRVKLRDLESGFRTRAEAGREGTNVAASLNEKVGTRTLDLNVGSASGTVGDEPPTGYEDMGRKSGFAKSRGFDLDLNAEDPFYPYKNYESLKSRDDSDCGSSIGPMGDRDSMRVWKGLKQNNFMSASHGTIPTGIPKPRGRKKTNNDAMKRKIELAKKEQVDRFARLAAPSGLLNGLNPGIINHVRNSKQVHSIIEALVKSERAEQKLSGGNQVDIGLRVDQVNRSRVGHGDNSLGKRYMGDYPFFSRSILLNDDIPKANADPFVKGKGIVTGMSLQGYLANENDRLALKLSSSAAAATENTSCLSNEESGNFSSVDSLSVKAATVASQWLELLSQDIKGRLAALRRSKKRVQAVITTELPLLISKEFPSNVSKPTVDAHSVKWSTLFGQMDNALSDEENNLENWLNQVKQMQLHCEKGISRSSSQQVPQLIGSIGNDNRSGEVDNSENDLAVRAAAASIYSTCNFLLSKENLPCF